MPRRVLSWFLRATEWPPAILTVLAVLSMLLSFLHEELAASLGTTSNAWVGRAAFVFSLLAALPVTLRDLNVWRLLPPRYRGVDPLISRIGKDIGLQGALFFGTDGRVRIDALAVLRNAGPLLGRVVFPTPDDAIAQSEIARINSDAFAGSRYGLSRENKLARNKAMAMRHPFVFALLGQATAEPGRYHGLTGTVPLDELSTGNYVRASFGDNAFNAEMMARPGEAVGSIVLFLIAHDPAHRESPGDDAILYDLLRCCLLQLVLIALDAKPQDAYLVIAANSNKQMKTLFGRLRLTLRTDFRNADGEDVYATDAVIKHREAALELLARDYPEIAARMYRAEAG